MSTPSIIAACFLCLMIALVIGFKIYLNYKKSGQVKLSVEEFIGIYGNDIISTLKDAIYLIQIQPGDFEDKENYEKTVIEYTIDMIKEHYDELGINIDIIDTSKLAEVVYNVFHANIVEVFSDVDPNLIKDNPEMYDNEVVAALSAAE